MRTATIRAVTIQMTSHLTDDLWDRMFAEIEESVEQIACDYAIACENDNYEVNIVNGGVSGSTDPCCAIDINGDHDPWCNGSSTPAEAP